VRQLFSCHASVKLLSWKKTDTSAFCWIMSSTISTTKVAITTPATTARFAVTEAPTVLTLMLHWYMCCRCNARVVLLCGKYFDIICTLWRIIFCSIFAARIANSTPQAVTTCATSITAQATLTFVLHRCMYYRFNTFMMICPKIRYRTTLNRIKFCTSSTAGHTHTTKSWTMSSNFAARLPAICSSVEDEACLCFPDHIKLVRYMEV